MTSTISNHDTRTIGRSRLVGQFISKATPKLFEAKLAAEDEKQGVNLIQDMIFMARKSGKLGVEESIRFKYAKHKIDALLKSKLLYQITISPKTDQLFKLEMKQFQEVIQLGKKYSKIRIELPRDISDDLVTYLKSVLAQIKNTPKLVIRNSVPLGLVDSLTCSDLSIHIRHSNRWMRKIL